MKGNLVMEKKGKRYIQNQILNDDIETKKGKKKKGMFSKFFNGISNLVILGAVVGLFLLYGPFTGFRDWYITTAMTTMTHQYLATWFYSSETIEEVLNRNRIIEINSVTDPSLVSTTVAASAPVVQSYTEYDKELLELDSNHPEYKIIEINEKKFSGYLAAVYDPSDLHVLVTEKLGKSGQYITTMAQKNEAKLAINGGFFVDLKEDRTGGTPLGLTIANGKVITDKSYSDEGGMIGFDTNNKLILGKVTAQKAKELNIRDCVTSGPFLIINGESSKVLGNGGWGTAPRTAIGQRKDGVVLMLVVDGRRVGKPGASMNDLIDIMERYGAYNAAALDGGTSSVMVENYKIINDPIDSDGKHKTRPVATGWGIIKQDD